MDLFQDSIFDSKKRTFFVSCYVPYLILFYLGISRPCACCIRNTFKSGVCYLKVTFHSCASVLCFVASEMNSSTTLTALPQSNYTCDVQVDLLSYLPWIQQPHSAFAFVYFACVVIGAAMMKYIIIAIVDCSRY